MKHLVMDCVIGVFLVVNVLSVQLSMYCLFFLASQYIERGYEEVMRGNEEVKRGFE